VSVAAPPRAMRIGDVAKEAGTTTRTIRYYEEIGLLPEASPRSAGQHRVYTQADVDRLREVLHLKSLLGVSLDELKELVEAEDARALIRREYRRSEDPARKRELLEQALPHIDRQLELVRRRRGELDKLEAELAGKRRRVRDRLRRAGRGSRSCGPQGPRRRRRRCSRTPASAP
jgi:MerR family transcriptional regulator, repressor of the yfmOP operon